MRRLMDEENEDLVQMADRLDLGKPKDNSNIYKKRDTTQSREFINLLIILHT